MRILFLGDVVGQTGCLAIKKKLQNIIINENIDFSVVNGENAANDGVGITENVIDEFLSCGVDVVTSGNHIWDQKETYEFIKNQPRLLRPFNMDDNLPGEGFVILNSRKGHKIGVLNLMGNVFMKKSNDIFSSIKTFLEANQLKKNYDCLVVDVHGEITSEKMAIGHFFDGKASLVVGTHTHVPTNDARILKGGTGYITDAGMCGDYDSVIGMDKNNSIKRFLKEDSIKHFPSKGEASISGVIVDVCKETGLALNIKSFISGGVLNNTN
ncbi:YmdB family metallophosphoesterase [Candidatus Pelagibacter sp.]|nr:YmdB family metallophosphoesterase [Candidatus Pelagibacter sp.]|tara:strand:- start:85 stop:891 length:807 start_codon:yes stop_codon:yes gene_type:complete